MSTLFLDPLTRPLQNEQPPSTTLNTTLSLSSGATREAGPSYCHVHSCRALIQVAVKAAMTITRRRRPIFFPGHERLRPRVFQRGWGPVGGSGREAGSALDGAPLAGAPGLGT